MSRPVRFTVDADVQADLIDAWWHEHRASAPRLFREELGAAVELIGMFPNVGHRHFVAGIRGVRRLVLRATRHHVYFVVRKDEVLIVAVWSGLRGVGPPLAP